MHTGAHSRRSRRCLRGEVDLRVAGLNLYKSLMLSCETTVKIKSKQMKTGSEVPSFFPTSKTIPRNN